MAAKAASAPASGTGGAERAGRSAIDTAKSSGFRTIMRREVAREAEIIGPGDWTMEDRESNTARWKSACLHNLQAGDSSQYVKIAERRDFYRWFYEYTVDQGYETRWALAASIVANGAQQVAYPGTMSEAAAQSVGTISNELQGFMRLGNQVIFDDVFLKLQRLLAGGPLTGAAALRWDMETLSEEQALVQALYNGMSTAARAQMAAIAKQQGFVVNVGMGLTSEDTVEARAGRDGRAGTADDYNRGGDVPAFPENADLTSVDARWRYGMGLGNTFAPRGTLYDPNQHTRPAPRPEYTDGTALTRVNTRQHLHMLDGELDDAMGMARVSRVQAVLGQLTDSEKAELARDRRPDGGTYSSRLAMLVRVPATRWLPHCPSLVPSAMPSSPAMIASDRVEISRRGRRGLRELAVIIMILAVGACMPRKADSGTGAVQGLSHPQLHAVLVHGDRWLAAGTAGSGQDGSILLMRGSAASARATTRIITPRAGQYARGLAELGPGRAVIVGETAVPGSEGPIGHPLYRGLWLEIDDEGKVSRQSILGVQGATSLVHVVRSGDRLIAGGIAEFHAWIVARRVDGEPLWDITWPDVNRVIALAASGEDRVAVLAAIGPSNAPSTPLVRVIDAAGNPLWSWRGRAGVDQFLVTIAADPRGGFVAAGSSGAQPTIVSLGPDGEERWSREFAAGDGTDRIQSVSVAPSGDILAAGRRRDKNGRRHLWVRVVSAGGEPLGEASSLDREEGEINASAAQRDGWLIVGARQTLPSPLRACIWRLDRRGNVLWMADATPPANGPE